LKNGGNFVATVFPEPSKAPIVGHSFFAIKEVLNTPITQPKVPGIFALANPNPLIDSLERVGFSEIETKVINNIFKFDNADQFRDFTRDVTPPINLTIQGISEEIINKIWSTFVQSANSKYTDKSGKLHLPTEIIYIIAKKA
jgi:hypothetical protein